MFRIEDITHRLYARTDALPCSRESCRSAERSTPARCVSECRCALRDRQLMERGGSAVPALLLGYAVGRSALWFRSAPRSRDLPSTSALSLHRLAETCWPADELVLKTCCNSVFDRVCASGYTAYKSAYPLRMASPITSCGRRRGRRITRWECRSDQEPMNFRTPMSVRSLTSLNQGLQPRLGDLRADATVRSSGSSLILP